MELSLFAAAVAALVIGALASVFGWIAGAARARAAGEVALRDAEKRASASGGRA